MLVFQLVNVHLVVYLIQEKTMQSSHDCLTHSSNHLIYFAHTLGTLKIKYGLFVYAIIIIFYYSFVHQVI